MAIGSAMLKAMTSVESSGNSTSGLAYPRIRARPKNVASRTARPMHMAAHMPSSCRMTWAVGLTNVDVTDVL
jgi:hypothetical protein